MNFFLDENFPKSAESYLQSLGHKTFSTRSTNLEGIDDHSIFQIAQEKDAIFLTTDKDFFHTVPFQFNIHSGIIVIALRLPDRKSILEKLKWAIENLEIEKFSNKVVLLRDNTYTVR